MRWRWLVVGLGAVIVAVVVGGLVFANRLINAQRDRILAAAESAIGRPVHVGDIGARFFGRPGVRLTDVSIADDPAFGSEPFVRAQSATVLLKLRALIEGRVEIARIELQKPSVRVVRAADGRFNYATLGPPPAPAAPMAAGAAPAGAARAGGAGLAWVVALFNMADGEIIYVDQAASPPKTTAFKKIGLNASDIALDQPVRFNLRAAYDAPDENIEIGGDVGPINSPDGIPFAISGTIGPLPQILPAVLSDLDLRGRAREQGIDVESAAFEGFGGKVSGHGTIPLTNRGPFSFIAKAEGIAVEQVLPVVAPQIQHEIEGTATAAIDVQGVGIDAPALRQSLRGSVSVDVEDGILHNLNLLGEVIGSLSDMPGLSKLISRGLKPKYAVVMNRPDTRFESMRLQLRLIEGGVEVQSMLLDGEDFGATASGRVMLPKNADLRGDVLLSKRFSADVAEDIKEARVLFNTEDQIDLPFIYRGVIGQTKPQPDLEKLGTSVLKGRGKDLVDALLKGGRGGESAAEALGRELKGLFGR